MESISIQTERATCGAIGVWVYGLCRMTGDVL